MKEGESLRTGKKLTASLTTMPRSASSSYQQESQITVETSLCGRQVIPELLHAGTASCSPQDASKSAPGPDNIPPPFMNELGTKALEILLSIYNDSFWLAACPQIWRTAIIVPLLKTGKPSGFFKVTQASKSDILCHQTNGTPNCGTHLSHHGDKRQFQQPPGRLLP